MTAWYVDKGLGVLVTQVRAKYPNIVIGTVGDAAHRKRKSDHNPDPDGSVDAADFMIGPSFTFTKACGFVGALTLHKDQRLKYIIWNRHIWYPGRGWYNFHGDDPHTDHVHVSVNDLHITDIRKWNLEPYMRKLQYLTLVTKLPILHEGDSDADLPGYNLIARMQLLKGAKPDGVWGPATTKAFGFREINTEQQWRDMLGLEKS